MRPVLLELGSLKFHAYPTMLAIAFLAATFLSVRDMNRLSPPIEATTHGGLFAFLGGLIGAKAFWIVQYWDPWQVWRAIFFWTQGLVFYGGLIGAVLAMLVYCVYNRFPVRRVADACAPYVALGEAITRVGCFLTGCCWGRETTVPWAVQFPKASSVHWYMRDAGLLTGADPLTPHLHPTQMYMSLGLLLLVFPALKYMSRRSPLPGSVALGYLFLYGLLRFTVEIFRGDSAHPTYNMTASQLISLCLSAGSVLSLAALQSTFFAPAKQPGRNFSE